MAIIITSAPKAGLWQPQLYKVQRLAKLPLVTLITALMWHPAQAVEFSVGDVEGRFDSNISVGASWRMDDRDPSLISVFNGGSVVSNGVNDDGNLNFDKHDTYSKIFKGVHDLSLTYNNMGAFVRGKYWYDFELEDESQRRGHGPNGYAAGQPLNDDGFNDYAQFSGAELLDAFVYSNFDLGEMPATVRLGRQVVSWGESTFIQGGINAINPIDVAAFRRPGAEIKEGLLPVNMLFGSLGVTDNLSVEGFYQLEWEKTVIDGCGTYFSTVDYIAEGCNTLTLGAVAAQTAQGLGAAAAAAAAGGDLATAAALGAQAQSLLDNNTTDPTPMQSGNRLHQSPEQLSRSYRQQAEQLCQQLNLRPDAVIVEEGPAETLIPAQAQAREAALVVLGTVARKGLSAALLGGNTAEAILSQLACDVLTVQPEGDGEVLALLQAVSRGGGQPSDVQVSAQERSSQGPSSLEPSSQQPSED